MTYARLSDEANQAKVDVENLKGILEYESKIFEESDLKDLEVKTGNIDIIFTKFTEETESDIDINIKGGTINAFLDEDRHTKIYLFDILLKKHKLGLHKVKIDGQDTKDLTTSSI